MTDDIEFHVHEVLTHEPIGRLDPKNYKFNDPIWGAGALEFEVAIPKGKNVSSLKRRTMPDQVEIFVMDGEHFLWGGILNWRARTPGTKVLKCKAQHWKGWFYTRLVPDRWLREQDDWQMVYELWDFAANDKGTPALYRGGTDRGIISQFTVEPFWSVGQALDNFGGRDNGFEWSIGFRKGSQTGLPEMFLELWTPGQTRGRPNLLFLDQSESTNRISVGDIEEDATERRPRVWATGEGTYPDQPRTLDEDPELKNDTILLRESVSNHSGVIETPTLFNHARSERLARNIPMTVLPIDHPYNKPHIRDYRSGDRARLRIRDEWDDIDIPGIRIIDRAVNKAEKGMPIATVQLDLTDVVLV